MRRFVLLLLFAIVVLGLLPAFAFAVGESKGGVDVAEMEGVVDQRMIDFLTDAVTETDADLVVLRIDSPGVASGDIASLADALHVATVPVVAWIGPQGARAYGGSLQIAAATDYLAAAPGVRIGYALPTVAGRPLSIPLIETSGLVDLLDAQVQLNEGSPFPPFISDLTPSIGQFLASIDGLEIGGSVVETAKQVNLEDGSTVTVPSVEVRFLQPDLSTRFLRLAIRPEAAFFFLLAGISLAVFELYAAGVGVVAVAAALCLFLSMYGLAALPIRWWAIVCSALGMILYTWDFQSTRLGWKSLLGTASLLIGGFYLIDAYPQFVPRTWTIVIVVLGVAAFYLFALTTVVRSRFSTRTIGREYLIGRSGEAKSFFDPEGVVSVDGASWKARAARAAKISPGDRVTVLSVRGIVLEVDPISDASLQDDDST